VKVKLSEIVDALQFLADESSSFLNRQTGEVVYVGDEDITAVEEEEEDGNGDDEDAGADGESLGTVPDWQLDEIEMARTVMADDKNVFVALPSKFDINEYEIMQDFCESVKNEQISNSLCRAIRGSGAFGRFKDSIHHYGIAENWYEFRDRAMKQIAIEWCEANEIPYIDDTPEASEPDDKELSEKAEQYQALAESLRNLLVAERDFIANAANMAALLFRDLPDLNWAGFYLLRGDDLVLGPFQGAPACARIPIGKGVCGTAAQLCECIVVQDVHKFPGHIACDKASKSEIVVPLIRDGQLLGVLDVDSPLLARFDEEDRSGLEKLVKVFLDLTA
jgi:L-methionine (R)-S-oxide reductase